MPLTPADFQQTQIDNRLERCIVKVSLALGISFRWFPHCTHLYSSDQLTLPKTADEESALLLLTAECMATSVSTLILARAVSAAAASAVDKPFFLPPRKLLGRVRAEEWRHRLVRKPLPTCLV